VRLPSGAGVLFFLPVDHPARDRPVPWHQGKAEPSASPAVRPWRAMEA
jgi:hypothetical protein